MHIPDGFISPQTYIPASIAMVGLWYAAKVKLALVAEEIPFLASLSALSFVLMMIVFPLPGGTSAHLSGVALMAVVFGPWMSFAAISLVLLIQALLLGEGGITSLCVNVLAIAFVGSFTAYYLHKLLGKYESIALFAAGFGAIVVSSFVMAIVLGIQPLIASDASGKALFFPFGLGVTIPAVMIPHLIVGAIEGVFTMVMYRFLRKNFAVLFHER